MELYPVFSFEYELEWENGQIVIEGNIFPAELTIDSRVPCGFDRNFVKHLQHCHVTIPKQLRNTNARNNRSSQQHAF